MLIKKSINGNLNIHAVGRGSKVKAQYISLCDAKVVATMDANFVPIKAISV